MFAERDTTLAVKKLEMLCVDSSFGEATKKTPRQVKIFGKVCK